MTLADRIASIQENRACSEPLPTGVSPYTCSDFFKTQKSTGKPKARLWDHRLSSESRNQTASPLKAASRDKKSDVISLGTARPAPQFYPWESLDMRCRNSADPAAIGANGKESSSYMSCEEGEAEFDLSVAMNYGYSAGSPQELRFVTEHIEMIFNPPYDDWQSCLCSSVSGQTNANRVIDNLAHDLSGFSQKLQRSLSSSHSTAEKEVADLARECAVEADALRRELWKLQTPDKAGKVSALVPALKSLWKSKEIEEMNRRLNNFRGQITLRLVALLNDKSSSTTTLLLHLLKMNSAASIETSSQLKELQATINQVKDLVYQAPEHSHRNSIGVEAIPQKLYSAHAKTFEWLFTDTFDFHKWLLSYDGTFWISGKPGSGKSTLMKFVSAHVKTKEALQSWAGDELLITADFYFWSAGTPMQKSLQGLLQSLLYQILKKCPLLIPVVAPERWGNAFNLSIEDPWTSQEVFEALDRFIAQKKFSCKSCLFIDGLDEFDGDNSRMVNLAFKISTASNIKLCLASRPYNVFQEAFSSPVNRMLRLQDLTKSDIYRYTKDNLENHPSFRQPMFQDNNYSLLIEEIVNKADGVFLWVYLVVRSLRDGLTNADTIITLRRRLRQLPSDLGWYFKHILSSVDEVYREGTAKSFQMATSATNLLPIGVFSILDDDDLDMCLNATIRSINLNEYKARVKVIEKRLNARCKGLLEVRQTPGEFFGSDDYNGRHLVVFLHRSVRDFLRLREVDALLRSSLKTSFDVDLHLCQGLLIQLKQFIIVDDSIIYRKLGVEKALEDLIYHARRVEIMTGNAPTKILDEAMGAVRAAGTTPTPDSMFYSVVIRHGLSQYLAYLLKSNPRIPPLLHQSSPLSLALTSATLQSEGSRYDIALEPQMIQTLLDNGANPNQPSTPGTVWTQFVRSCDDRLAVFTPEACVKTFYIMLKAGADRYDGLIQHIERLVGAHEARLIKEFIRELDADTDQIAKRVK